MAPERSEGTTKGLRVIISVVSCALKSTFFRLYKHVLAPFAIVVTTKHHENVVVIGSHATL